MLAGQPATGCLADQCSYKSTVGKNSLWSQNILRVQFHQTRVSDCWNNGPTKQDGFGHLYFVSVKFEQGVFNDDLLTKMIDDLIWF